MGDESLLAEMKSRKRRLVLLFTLLVGLYLAAVPTYYSIFVSRAESDPLRVRLILFGLWVIFGLYVLWRAWGRDEVIEQAMADRRSAQRQVRTSATEDVLDALTRPGVLGLPESYEITIYVYDAVTNFLEPYYPHVSLPAGQEDHRRFQPGRGSTGRAWEEGHLFYVRGEPVATDEFNLTEDQRELFKTYRSAAATPIRDDQGGKIGVVTALGPVDDGFFEPRGHGQQLLRNIADTFGVVLTSVPDPADLVVSRQ
jgi:hypothetical protein